MIDLAPETEGKVIVIQAGGTITKNEEEALLQKLMEHVVDTPNSFRVLADYAGVESQEKGVVSAGLWFEMRYHSRVERFAVIGGGQWDDECARLTDIFKIAEVRRFEPDDRGAGLAWIKS